MSDIPKRTLHWRMTVGGWLLLDALAGFMAMNAAYLLTPYSASIGNADGTGHSSRFYASLLFAFLIASVSHIFGLHNPLQNRQFGRLVVRSFGSVFIALGAFALVVFAVLYHQIGRYIMGQSALYTPALMITVRAVLWRQARQRRQRLLFVGASQPGQQLRHLIRENGVPLDLVAVLEHRPELLDRSSGEPPAFESPQPLTSHCREMQIDEVVTCIGGKISDDSMRQLMDCLSLGVRVSDYSNFVERNFLLVPVENIRSEWFLQADLELAHPVYVIVKRATDIAISILGLMLLSPVLLVAAAAIKLESRGPVFYSQIRSGLHNRSFKILKLRSMRTDAEKDGPKWAAAKDSRVTRIGSILRRTRLDEVPQFWNILRGEMSLVGPRPERPEFVEQLAEQIPYYQQRHLVKPGLTGWAQINYPYGATIEDALCKLRYDLYYIKHASVGLDLQIALRTIGVAMKGSR